MTDPRSPLEDWRVDRRGLLGLGGLALLAAASPSQAASARRAAAGATRSGIENALLIYTWASYTDPATESGFAKQYHVKITETDYTSNEELLSKLLTTRGQKQYDIVVPDGDHVRIESQRGLLMKLDHTLIPNLKYLGPQWRTLSYDRGNRYSVPKDAGVTAFTYRTDRVKAKLRTWKDFFDFLPHANGLNVNFIESPAEVIGVALNALGYSMNTESDKELGKARDLLLKVRPHVTTINEVYIPVFSAGKIDLGITYSGDGLRVKNARKKQNDIRVVLPEGRSELWIDNWSISSDAPHPKAAHAFINYVLEPKNNAREMRFHHYEVPTPGSFKYVGSLAKNPDIVFPKRIFKDYEILKTTPDGIQKRTQIWNEFKAA